jgi:hypothetical protein
MEAGATVTTKVGEVVDVVVLVLERRAVRADLSVGALRQAGRPACV